MEQNEQKGFVMLVEQKINAASKHGAITGAQHIAFKRRLEEVWERHADKDELYKALQSIENDLLYWEQKKTSEEVAH